MKRIVGGIVVLIALNMLLPSNIQNPVEGCGKTSYNPQSFWHPWGDHNHRGVDIFAPKGTAVHPSVGGIVVAAMHTNGAGGNIVLVFSSKMRFHYYAHMSEIDTHVGAIVTKSPSSARSVTQAMLQESPRTCITASPPSSRKVTGDGTRSTASSLSIRLRNWNNQAL